MSKATSKAATAAPAPVDLSSYRWVAFGHTWGIIVPKGLAEAAIAAGAATTPGSKNDPAPKVQAVKGLYTGKDGVIWCGKGGTDQGKRFLTFPTKGDLAKAAAPAPAPAPAAPAAPAAAPAPKGPGDKAHEAQIAAEMAALKAAAAAPAAAPAPAADLATKVAALKAAGFTLTEILAAIS